jgi:hypothetical protein
MTAQGDFLSFWRLLTSLILTKSAASGRNSSASSTAMGWKRQSRVPVEVAIHIEIGTTTTDSTKDDGNSNSTPTPRELTVTYPDRTLHSRSRPDIPTEHHAA